MDGKQRQLNAENRPVEWNGDWHLNLFFIHNSFGLNNRNAFLRRQIFFYSERRPANLNTKLRSENGKFTISQFFC